jgi:hypothetical protein
LFAQHASLALLGIRPHHGRDVESPTAKYLQDLSVTMLASVSARDWPRPEFKFLAPDFVFHAESGYETITAKGSDSVGDMLQKLVTSIPEYCSSNLDVGAEVNERTGKASVWVWSSVHNEGFPVLINFDPDYTLSYWLL